MYNRYIGNTGRYYRVDDTDDMRAAPEPKPAPEPESPPIPSIEDNHPAKAQGSAHEEHESPYPDEISEESDEKKKKFTFEPEKIAKVPGNLRGLIKTHMPESIDLGDILLVLILLYLFIENDDDEVLLVLIILIFMWVKPLLIKDDDE